MAKCGKGCMPECEYFTTGGCISPFNCMYKEESGYINSATSGKIFYTGGMNMTNEELKKKICEIIAPYVSAWGEDERIADALIAAGIGDVKELQLDKKAYEAASNHYIILFEEAERRAEVAEKALDLCETAYILSLNHRATEGISGQAIASDLGVHKFFMEQAEKELAEEGKE